MSMELCLPSLDEQRVIVNRLDAAAAIRRRAEAARDKARALSQALFLDMFGDPATGEVGGDQHALGDLIAETRLGLVRGRDQISEEYPIPYIRMDSVGMDGSVRLTGLKRVRASPAERELGRLRSGDLLFNTRNSRELVGKMGVYRGAGKELFNNNLMRIRFKPGVTPDFISQYFQTSTGRAAIEAVKSGTTSVFAVYYKDLSKVPVPLPPLDQQETFSGVVARIDALITALDAAVSKADAAAAALSAEVFG
jgi:type I restriction enzyme S subunit